MFDFRRIATFCLEKPSRSTKWLYFLKICGVGHEPIGSPGCAYAQTPSIPNNLTTFIAKCLIKNAISHTVNGWNNLIFLLWQLNFPVIIWSSDFTCIIRFHFFKALFYVLSSYYCWLKIRGTFYSRYSEGYCQPYVLLRSQVFSAWNFWLPTSQT